MKSISYSSDRSATVVAHCFTPSDLMPMVRAHVESSGDAVLRGVMDGLGGIGSRPGSQSLLFYLSNDKSQAAHQLGAMSGLMQELYVRSLQRASWATPRTFL